MGAPHRAAVRSLLLPGACAARGVRRCAAAARAVRCGHAVPARRAPEPVLWRGHGVRPLSAARPDREAPLQRARRRSMSARRAPPHPVRRSIPPRRHRTDARVPDRPENRVRRTGRPSPTPRPVQTGWQAGCVSFSVFDPVCLLPWVSYVSSRTTCAPSLESVASNRS